MINYCIINTICIMEANMVHLDLLKSRKAELLEKTAKVRQNVSTIVDEGSFVEFNSFSFAKNEFYDKSVDGLGVLTGYATVDGYPVYVVAQNKNVLNGGISKANADKIVECLSKAYSQELPVIYFLESQGVQVGEGVAVLEGISTLLSASNSIKEVAPQIVIATGDVLGSVSLLASNADFVFAVNGACISYASPTVISASKVDGSKESVANAKNSVKTFDVKSLEDAKTKITHILNVLPRFSGYEVDTVDDFMRGAPNLNNGADAESLIDATFDNGEFIKMNEGYANSVVTGIGRVGGISTAGIVFDGGEKGVDITLDVVIKIKNFANFASDNKLPVVMLVNTNGIKIDDDASNSPVTVEFMNMLYNLSSLKRVTVVYGKAIGLGYAFASKSLGSDYNYAFAGAKISLLDDFAGISATFGTVDPEEINKLSSKYLEEQDGFNSAKLGCIDNIIEPENVRQYVISALQMIL